MQSERRKEMRKKIVLPIATLIISCMLITSCSGGSNTDPAPDPEPSPAETQYDINELVGFYGAYNNSIGFGDGAEISVDGNNTISVYIMRSESTDVGNIVKKVSEWTMSGAFDNVTGIFTYSDAVKTQKTVEITGYDEGDVTSEDKSYTDGSGHFFFKKENNQISFTWEDNKENAGEGYIYKQDAADLLTPEDLLGRWGQPVSGGIVLDIQENGTLDSYVLNEETGDLNDYKDGSWSIEGRDVRITLGDTEHHLHGNSKELIEFNNPYHSLRFVRTE